ncbi:MAG: patatin-like phospholipase family protein, partial [Acetobacteraceae bacterium]
MTRRPSGSTGKKFNASRSPAPDEAPAARQPALVDLALQGGGAHGAFTWGVLDRLLEENWLRIEGV